MNLHRYKCIQLAGARCTVIVAIFTLQACSFLKPVSAPATSYYSLDFSSVSASIPVAAVKFRPTLIVNPPSAASGYGSSRIVYLREQHKIEYFANSEWIESPARMLAPLLITSLQSSGAFQAVVLTPSAVAADWRLNTEIVRLQHEFFQKPSRVRFTLRAHIVDEKSRRILGIREFDISVTSDSENAYGGVLAAHTATVNVLKELATFTTQIAEQLKVQGRD